MRQLTRRTHSAHATKAGPARAAVCAALELQLPRPAGDLRRGTTSSDHGVAVCAHACDWTSRPGRGRGSGRSPSPLPGKVSGRLSGGLDTAGRQCACARVLQPGAAVLRCSSAWGEPGRRKIKETRAAGAVRVEGCRRWEAFLELQENAYPQESEPEKDRGGDAPETEAGSGGSLAGESRLAGWRGEGGPQRPGETGAFARKKSQTRACC